MSESFDASETVRGIGQRGPDKQPREFNPKSLSNLKQFQEPVPEVNSNFNWSKIGIVLVLIMIFGFVIWKIWNRKKHD